MHRRTGNTGGAGQVKLILHFTRHCSEPVAWCELCNSEITNAGSAMLYWRPQDYQKHLHAPLLAHKQCMAARPSLDEHYPCSMELITYLGFLLANVRAPAIKG